MLEHLEKCKNSGNVGKSLYRYQKMGLPVVPCRGKAPVLRNWQARNTHPNDEEIADWLAKWPDLNVGLVLGSASGIVGIDVDGEAAWKKLQEISGGDIPDTWMYKTPGSDVGRRLLYKLPDGAGKAVKWVEKLQGEHSELAFLGDGQQTILPPSIHPNGSRYVWIKGHTPSDVSIAMAPKWLFERMLGQKSKLTKIPRPQVVAKKPSGEEDAVLERLKCCRRFAEASAIQGAEGVSEDAWFSWVSLLVNAGQAEAAIAFSRKSEKHDGRSQERIELLVDKVGTEGGPMMRCSTFGCTEEEITNCFEKINKNEAGDVTNSPGALIKETVEPLHPTDPAYIPYVKALQENSDYDIDEKGNLIIFDRKGQPSRIANFVARPIAEVIRDDGVSQERTFRIEGLQAGGKTLSPVDVSASDFKRMGWVAEEWGIGPSIRPGFGAQDVCRDAIQNMAMDVEKNFIYTHLGWRRLLDGRWCYLHAGGSIGAEDISVEIERSLKKYHFGDGDGNLKEAARASLRLLMVAPLEVTLPLMALTYLAPLCEAFRMAGIEPTFVLWLFGGTGTRKTSLAMLFLAHFGDFGTKSPPASFKDTANALERKAFATKDTLLLIDDFHPESSRYEAQKMAQTAQRVLRIYGDRIGRGRLSASIQLQKDFPPRGMALVTGEDVPNGESSVARFIGVELLPEAVNLVELARAQKEASALGDAMRGYIEWLIPQMDELPSLLYEKFLNKRGDFQKKAAHGRSGEAATWLYLGFHFMLQFMKDADACNDEVAEKLAADAEIVFAHLISDQNALVAQERPADVFVEVLRELLMTNKVRVDKLGNGVEEDVFAMSCGERIGWYDHQFLFLLPEATYNAVDRFLAGRREKIAVSARSLWKNLEERGIISVEKGADGRVQRCPKCTIPSKALEKNGKNYRPRLLRVYKHILEDAASEE